MRGMRRKGNTMKHSTEFHTPELPFWLNQSILLAEGEEDLGGNEDEGTDPAEEEPEDTAGLKSALQKERAARREAEKTRKAELAELDQLRREREERELAEKTEIEQAQARAEKAEAKAQALAESYVRDKLESTIKELAQAAKFADPEDAVALVDRSNITYQQDAENPQDVTIDKASVEKAVKDLATRKPHYLKAGTDDGEPTGSSFGGGNQKKKPLEEEALREKYPSLR